MLHLPAEYETAVFVDNTPFVTILQPEPPSADHDEHVPAVVRLSARQARIVAVQLLNVALRLEGGG